VGGEEVEGFWVECVFGYVSYYLVWFDFVEGDVYVGDMVGVWILFGDFIVVFMLLLEIDVEVWMVLIDRIEGLGVDCLCFIYFGVVGDVDV